MDLALNNLQWYICHKTQPNQPTNPPIRMDLEVMTLKGYSTHPRSPEMQPNHHMQFRDIPRTPFWECRTPSTRNTVCVFPTSPTGWYNVLLHLSQLKSL